MLSNLETMSLNQTMKDAVETYDNKEYEKLKMLAHSLKGASAYIGASRLHYICFFIQHYYNQHDYEQMMQYYPNLVEAAIEFRTYYRKIISQSKGKLCFPV